jgi:hypothetical protein
VTPEELAELFHTHYEAIAKREGYKTREESAVPWSEVPEDNKRVMVLTAAAVLRELEGTSGKASSQEIV